MKIMMADSTSSEHSPPLSENAGSSWANWENEISSISGLNLGSNSELNGLVEDKEIAARAVAFVVNSTRKGIVPLCADVANLLHAKRRLEKKVFLFKRENEALRSSTSISFRTSHSTSPTPPSYNSYTDKSLLHDHSTHIQERSRPCSRCSQCSSTLSNSPKFEKSYSFKGQLHSPSARRESRCRGSPYIGHRPVNGVTTQAIIHNPPEGITTGSGNSNLLPDRKNSLPEIISEPNGSVKRISPKISKEIQCSIIQHSDSSLEEQFIETVKLNSKLAEDLGAARKEIEILKGRLKELEMNHLARECVENFHLENECEDTNCTGSNEEKSLKDFLIKQMGQEKQFQNGLSKPKMQKKMVVTSRLYPEPLFGCKCTACEEAIGGDDNATLPESLSEDLQRFPVSSKLQVQLGDHIVIKGERTGFVRYIGHLDKIGQANMVFVGLELDAPVGRHDGFFSGKRYFFCQKDHGIFLPLHDIVCKVQTKKSSSIEESSIDKTMPEDSSTLSPAPRNRTRTPSKSKVDETEPSSYETVDNREQSFAQS